MSPGNSRARHTGGDRGGAWSLSAWQVKGFRNPLRSVSTPRRLANDLRATARRSR
jgi:hypothetical protein